MIFKNPKNKVQIRCIFYKNTMVGDSKIYALCILCILDQLLRKGALFFRKRGLFKGTPKQKKRYPRGPRFSLGDPPDIPDFGIEPTLLGSKCLIPIFC